MPNFSKKYRLWLGGGEAAGMLIVSLSLRPPRPDRSTQGPRSSLDAWAIRALPPEPRSCYILGMKKILAAVLLLMVFASPALAASRHHRNHHLDHHHHHHHHHA